MAAVDPVVLGVGIVREVNKSEYLDKTTGEYEDRGFKVTLLSRAGVFQFNLPKGEPVEAFPLGAPCVVWLRYKIWNFRGRDGVSLIFDTFARDAVAKVMASEMVSSA